MIKKNLKIDDMNIAYIDKGDKNKDHALIFYMDGAPILSL